MTTFITNRRRFLFSTAGLAGLAPHVPSLAVSANSAPSPQVTTETVEPPPGAVPLAPPRKSWKSDRGVKRRGTEAFGKV